MSAKKLPIMKIAQPAPNAVCTRARPRYSFQLPVNPSVRNHGSSGTRMICTGTIIVVISKKYVDRLNRKGIRAKA